MFGIFKRWRLVWKGLSSSKRRRQVEESDFDDVFIHELLQLIRLQEIVQRVVKGPQVGEDFFLQVAGQESKSLPCFDGWPCENEPFHFLLLEGGNGGCHCEVGLACSSRADAKGDVVGLDRLDIGFLSSGARNNRRLAWGALNAGIDETGKGFCGAWPL